jgi:AcrR family transcriptional regulator
MSAVLTEREPALRVGDLEGRAVEALLACVARQGLRKTTLDDVARQAGTSRATLYRYFASKQAVVDAAVRLEAARVTHALLDAAAATTTLDDAIVAVLRAAHRELTGHPALTYVAAYEPEWLLPSLCFGGLDGFLARASVALAPAFAPYVGADQAARGAEWVTRIGLTLLCAPHAPVPLDDEAAVRRYAAAFIVPALTPPTVSPNPSRR